MPILHSGLPPLLRLDDAMMPALTVGTGLGILPEFFLGRRSPQIGWKEYCRIGLFQWALFTG